MGEFENDIIEKEYGISKKSVTPSMYGKNKRRFATRSNVFVEKELTEYNLKILDLTMKEVAKGRPGLTSTRRAELRQADGRGGDGVCDGLPGPHQYSSC